ncbi:MAG: hypothetical protein GEU93_20660 [Propionibacteriales bacterium]|nr:hypothetical protein [Propionibacteriales bacterium]MQA06513.1 hypothetical protein [Streptosporangiales bacterium]
MSVPIEYETRKIQLPRTMSTNAARQLLTDHAEYGSWELARLRRYPDGTKDVWLRRKIIRARRPYGWAPPTAAD